MTAPAGWYVLLDAIGIQSYIFETNKLKIILGSSLALDEWQQGCRGRAGTGSLITSAGGNVLAVFDKEENARAFCTQCLEHAPPDMGVAWALSRRVNGTDDRAVWKDLQRGIGRFKMGDLEQKIYPAPKASGIPGCQYCGTRAADEKGPVEQRNICHRCRTLYTTGEGVGVQGESGLGRLLSRFREESGDVFPLDLEQLVTDDGGELDSLAAVVIDLNGMGDRIRSEVKTGGFSSLKTFSEQLSRTIEEIVAHQIAQMRNNLLGYSIKNRWLRVRPLVVAGDDLIFLLPARLWPSFARDILNSLAEKNLPACAGVAIARHNFPVNRLVLMAESLCANAKTYLRIHGSADESALDWHMHQESVLTDPLAARRRRYVRTMTVNREYSIATRRPYEMKAFDALISQAKGWARIGSNRQLFRLYAAVMEGPRETRDMLTYHFLRREDEAFSRFKPIWDTLREGFKHDRDSYPLWVSAREDDDRLLVHRTDVADQLELRWFMEGDEQGEKNDE